MRNESAPSSSPKVSTDKQYTLQRTAVLLAGLLLCAGVLVPLEKGPPPATGSEALDRCRFQSTKKISIYREFTRSDLCEHATPLQNEILQNRQTLIHYQSLRMGNACAAIFYFVFRDEVTAERAATAIENSVGEFPPSRIERRIRRFGQIVVLIQGYPTGFAELSEAVFAQIERNYRMNNA